MESAIPIENPQSALPAQAGPWLPLARAAEILGVSAETVRRMCRSGELAYRPVPAGSRTYFEVDGRCRAALRIALGITDDPALALAGEFTSQPVNQSTDLCLAGLSRAKREVVLARYQVIRAWQSALDNRDPAMGRSEFTAAWSGAWNLTHPAGERIARSTLYHWQAALAERGLAGLIDRRHNHGGAATCDERAWQFFAGLYLRQSRPHITAVYEQVRVVAEAERWAWPSLRTVCRWATERLDPGLKILGHDPKRFNDRCLPTTERDWSKIPAMCLWVADHRQLDVLWPRLEEWTQNGKQHRAWKWRRPWLTMFLDARSWKPVARTLCFDSPNGNRVMATFARGVLEHGTPEVLYLDNGKDFRMRRFAGGRMQNARPGEPIVPQKQVVPLLTRLGVQAVFAIPYNARAKTIEPWFKLMADKFDRTWPTYCGRNEQVRPVGLKLLAKKQAEFLAGRMDAETFTRIATQSMPQEERDRISLAPLQTAFDGWVNDDYGQRESPSTWCMGLSANEAFAQLRRPDFKRVCPSAADMALLLMPSVAVRIEPQGLYVRPFGQYYDAGELDDRRCGSGRDLKRKVSYRFDPDDPSRIYVFDFQTDSFVCVAAPYAGAGMHPLAAILGDQADRDRLSDAMEAQRHVARVVSRQLRDAHRFAGNVLLAQSAKAGQAEGLALAADNISLVRPEAKREQAVLQFNGEITRAAQAGERHEQKQAAEAQRARSFREFFQTDKRATGTDDAADVPPANPFANMTDRCPGTDAPVFEQEPNDDPQRI